MAVLTWALAAFLVVTSGIKALSAVYFEIAFAIMNRLCPDGLPHGDARIPNYRAAGFLWPKWLLKAGHVANWLQYAVTIPVFFWFGSMMAIAYFVFVFAGVKVIMVVASNLRSTRAFATELMHAHLTRRVRLRQFRWDSGTSEEGEELFELLFTEVLALLDNLPEPSSGAEHGS